MSTFLSPTKSCSATATPTEPVVVTNKSFLERDNGASELYYGEKLADSLDLLLQKIRQQGLEVDPKDRERLNHKCFAPGNPEPEFQESATSTQSFQYLSSLVEGLRADPRGRSHVVDHFPSPFTEDSFWLSLPKWQAKLASEDINWSVVTMRSIDRSTFRECFYEWDVKHVHGTAMVTNNSSRNNSTTQALFSDQPRMVAHHGRSMGGDPAVELVIRVFRCAPRASLRDGIATVLAQDCPNTVFDLWIRHHEVPELVDGFGRFQHDIGSDVTLLQLLTDVDHSPSLMCLQPATPPQIVEVGPSPPPRPQGRPTAPLPEHYASHLALDEEQDASYNGDLDTSIDSEYRKTRWTPASPIPCAKILPNVLTISIPRPIQVWFASPVSPAMATAARSEPTALPSVDDSDDFPIFDDGAWPNLRPLPDPILVRVLTEDMDMVVGLEDGKIGECFGASKPKEEDQSLFYSFSFPEDYVGGHHRMCTNMATTKAALPKKQRRKKKDKQGKSIKRNKRMTKTGVSSAAAAAITDENAHPMHNENGATCGFMYTSTREASRWILHPAIRVDSHSNFRKYDRVGCINCPQASEITPGN